MDEVSFSDKELLKMAVTSINKSMEAKKKVDKKPRLFIYVSGGLIQIVSVSV